MVAHLPTIDEFSLMDPVTHGLTAHAPDLRGTAAIYSIPHRSQATEAAGSGGRPSTAGPTPEAPRRLVLS
jgi:hypothetical protein